MAAIKPDTRSRESMAAGKGGEWSTKTDPVKGRKARKSAAAGAPKRKFATIDGKRVEVRQAPPKEARPYPSAPVTARPGSRVAANAMRGHTDPLVKPLPRRAIGPKLDVARSMTKREAANNLPFMPEFQAEGQPYPRMARDESGQVMPRVRTDNGMTRQLQGRGIERKDAPTWTKRQLAAMEVESKAMREAQAEHARLRRVQEDYQETRKQTKQALMDAIGRERDALARGDQEAAEAARAEVRQLRKAAKYKG
jgi:hypothetical protein